MGNFLSRLAGRAIGLAPVAQPVIPSIFSSGLRPGKNQSSEFRSEVMVDGRERNIRSGPTSEVGLPSESAAIASYNDGRDPSLPDFVSAQAETDILADSIAISTRVQSPQASSLSTELKSGPHHDRARSPNALPASETKSSGAYSLLSREAPRQPRIPVTGRRPPGGSSSFQVDLGAPSEVPPASGAELEIDRLNTLPAGSFRAFGKTQAQNELSDQLQTNQDYSLPVTRNNPAGVFKFTSAIPFPESARRESPVIRVTIGRVDVRAQFPAPAPSPQRRARPATPSLNEYLKQRSEGKR